LRLLSDGSTRRGLPFDRLRWRLLLGLGFRLRCRFFLKGLCDHRFGGWQGDDSFRLGFRLHGQRFHSDCFRYRLWFGCYGHILGLVLDGFLGE
jgi:hypothetical protein